MSSKKKKLTQYEEYWVVKNHDGSYLCGAHSGRPWWTYGTSLHRDRYKTKRLALEARELKRTNAGLVDHTAAIVKVTVRR